MLKPLAGSIERDGLEARDIAYLPQAAEIDRSFPVSVDDLVAMGLWRRRALLGGIGGKRPRGDRPALAAVGLAGFEQRADRHAVGRPAAAGAVCPLLLQDARLILLDEPFNAIDAKTVGDLMR